MYPLIPFAAGLVAGALGIRLLKSAKTPSLGGVAGTAKEQLGRAQEGLRQATVSSLSAIEQSSASLRARLTPVSETAEVPAPDAAPKRGQGAAKPPPPRKAVRKKGAPPADTTGADS